MYITVLITVLVTVFFGGIALVYYGRFGDFSTPKPAMDFTLDGNYTVYQISGFQYESICSALTENSNLCGYKLIDLNFNKKSATAYSQQNCINGEQHSGTYDSKTLVCTDDAKEYKHDDVAMAIALSGIGILSLYCLLSYNGWTLLHK